MKFSTLVDWEGPTRDPAWDRRLEQLSPRRERATWLKLVWVPGDVVDSRYREESDPSVPRGLVERWFIYQMYPLAVIPDLWWDMIEDDLMGPNPRNRGRFDGVMGYRPDPSCNIDMMQWLLWKETGCLGRPLWVIEGQGGGHQYRWNQAESAVSVLTGGPKEPPVPGSQSYAEPDNRTWGQLEARNTMRQVIDVLAAVRQDPTLVEDEEMAQMSEMQRIAAAYIEKQTDEATGWAGTGDAGSPFRITNTERQPALT